MDDGPTSYLAPHLETRNNNGSRSVLARHLIRKGDVIAVWGGEVCRRDEFFELSPSIQRISIQIEDDLYLAPRAEGPAEWINHSCDPNAGMSGQVVLVAMRDIMPGEEICYDYAMSDGSPYDEFECQCGSPHCRNRVTGNDWQIPALWHRYDGYFSPYLQRRIHRLRRITNPAAAPGVYVNGVDKHKPELHPSS